MKTATLTHDHRPLTPTPPTWAVLSDNIGLDRVDTTIFYSKETRIQVKLMLSTTAYRYETVTVRIEEWVEPCGCTPGPHVAVLYSVPDLDVGLLPADTLRVAEAMTRFAALLEQEVAQ